MTSYNKRKKKGKQISAGLPPGEIVYTGQVIHDKSDVTAALYSPETLKYVEELPAPEALEEYVLWIDLRGLHEVSLIQKLGQVYGIHPLLLEDIADIHQRPKFEEFPTGLFFTCRAVSLDENLRVRNEHLAIYCGKNFVLTFQETNSDEFEGIRNRIKLSKGRVRQRQADYLLYIMIDLVVDKYYIVLERLGDEIEKLELKIQTDPQYDVKDEIYQLKRTIRELRKSIMPLKEAINKFSRCDNPLIDRKNMPFLRDLHDHITDGSDYLEMYRESLSNLHDLYTSEINNKMNQVMQVLTIIATIFIPLTFIAGVYGMNFTNMPELDWKYGYYAVWVIMLVVAIGLIIYFKRKNWL